MGDRDGLCPDFQLQLQTIGQEGFDGLPPGPQLVGVLVQQHEVIDIAQIMVRLEGVLDELIELVKVNVGKELAGQIADWQAIAGGLLAQPLVRRHGLMAPRRAETTSACACACACILGQDDAAQPLPFSGFGGSQPAAAHGAQ